jgi:hypothetical protein
MLPVCGASAVRAGMHPSRWRRSPDCLAPQRPTAGSRAGRRRRESREREPRPPLLSPDSMPTAIVARPTIRTWPARSLLRRSSSSATVRSSRPAASNTRTAWSGASRNTARRARFSTPSAIHAGSVDDSPDAAGWNGFIALRPDARGENVHAGFVPAATRTSEGATNPAADSNVRSVSPTSAHAAARTGSGQSLSTAR